MIVSTDPMSSSLEPLRHSTAHLLAAAVLEIWPNAKPTIGPPTEDGFYYDFDMGDSRISDEDLSRIEQKMREIVKGWVKFEQMQVSVQDARVRYTDNEYKLELIDEIQSRGEPIMIYRSGEFEDLCRGGHVEHPSEMLKHFKLMSVAGAYWRGDERNTMLTRIYGTAFATKQDLDTYLKNLEEAKKRDHKRLGRELDLFTFSEFVGSGLPLYTPRGTVVRQLLSDYIESIQREEGYTQVWTPQIAKAELFKRSGHYDKYREDMFVVQSHYSDEEMYLKPMNCPQHTQIYASKPRSYRDLPMRLTDFAMLYRDEKPGQLSGLARVRSFSTDDCHVFCREDQVDDEVDKMLAMTKRVMKTFDFTYKYRLSTRDPQSPDSYLGDPKVWDKVERWAVDIMKRNDIQYFDAPGEASFYAPKMDLIATDALGREWQLSTVQIDYVQPTRFALEYTDRDGSSKTPVMIHRAILGSAERMMMILIEHYAGAFPVWLAPVQVALLSIGESHIEYTQYVAHKLTAQGIRVEVDIDARSIGAKIRTQTLQKVPYMGIIGDKEVEADTLSVRSREGKDMGQMSVGAFIQQLSSHIENRS